MNDDDFGLTLEKVDVMTRKFLIEKCGVDAHVAFVLEMHRQDGSVFGGCDFLTFADVAQFLNHMSTIRYEIFCAEDESSAEIERLLHEVAGNTVNAGQRRGTALRPHAG